jgi:hypothetical protein
MGIQVEKMEFEIEEGYELKERDTIQAGYPFDMLKIGQSFFVPNKTPQQMSAAKAHWRRKFPDRQWVTRKAQKEINGEMVSGTRVGRTQ